MEAYHISFFRQHPMDRSSQQSLFSLPNAESQPIKCRPSSPRLRGRRKGLGGVGGTFFVRPCLGSTDGFAICRRPPAFGPHKARSATARIPQVSGGGHSPVEISDAPKSTEIMRCLRHRPMRGAAGFGSFCLINSIFSTRGPALPRRMKVSSDAGFGAAIVSRHCQSR